MKISRKIKFFIALFSLLYCISLIQSTYAKYVSSANANANLTIARWDILINTQDVKENSDFTNTITPVFDGNANTAANVIAPTSTGYFDLTLNGTNTDVSYNYTITITNDATSTVTDLILTKYTDTLNVEHTFVDNNYVITNQVAYNATNKVDTYRIYLTWNDDATNTMDNAADTATANTTTKLNVVVNIKQIAN